MKRISKFRLITFFSTLIIAIPVGATSTAVADNSVNLKKAQGVEHSHYLDTQARNAAFNSLWNGPNEHWFQVIAVLDTHIFVITMDCIAKTDNQ